MNRSIQMHLRSLDVPNRTVDCIASTDAIDSYGEIVEQVWDLSRFLTNPVVLYAHAADQLPIGRASDVRVERGALRATITFASAAANPKAEQCWQLVRENMLGAVSVGFVPRSIRTETRDGRDVDVLSDNELYEISVTPLPANASALMRSRDAQNGGDAPAVMADTHDLANLALRHAVVAGLDPEREATELALHALSHAGPVPGRAPTSTSSKALDIEPSGIALALLALEHASQH